MAQRNFQAEFFRRDWQLVGGVVEKSLKGGLDGEEDDAVVPLVVFCQVLENRQFSLLGGLAPMLEEKEDDDFPLEVGDLQLVFARGKLMPITHVEERGSLPLDPLLNLLACADDRQASGEDEGEKG